VGKVLDLEKESGSKHGISRKLLTPARLRQTVLLGLAEQMGSELAVVRGEALRRSAMLRERFSWQR
jgi:hypothetical protein